MIRLIQKNLIAHFTGGNEDRLTILTNCNFSLSATFSLLIDTLDIGGLILQTTSNAPVTLTTEGVRGSFSESKEGEWLSFDGIVNAFPVGTFSRHTGIQSISLQGEMEGDIAIQIRHVDEDAEHILYEEPFSHRNGHWGLHPSPSEDRRVDITFLAEFVGRSHSVTLAGGS